MLLFSNSPQQTTIKEGYLYLYNDGTLLLLNRPTCFNLVLESILAVHQQLVQVQRILGDAEVDDFLQLFWL